MFRRVFLCKKMYIPTCFAIPPGVSIITISTNVVLQAWGGILAPAPNHAVTNAGGQTAGQQASHEAMQLATQPCSQPCGHAARKPFSHRTSHIYNETAHTSQTAGQLLMKPTCSNACSHAASQQGSQATCRESHQPSSITGCHPAPLCIIHLIAMWFKT